LTTVVTVVVTGAKTGVAWMVVVGAARVVVGAVRVVVGAVWIVVVVGAVRVVDVVGAVCIVVVVFGAVSIGVRRGAAWSVGAVSSGVRSGAVWIFAAVSVLPSSGRSDRGPDGGGVGRPKMAAGGATSTGGAVPCSATKAV
jgi:hypothetical protein